MLDAKPIKILNAAVLVAALGYFVDIYDLLLFSIVRVPSLTDLGYSGTDLTSKGLLLINTQMVGMLLGGILWGVLGDKRGRLSVLFGSIITYSVANMANGFVTDIYSYAVLRFIAGVGLAGELGVGITLVTEVMPKETRGYAATVVATVGLVGAIFAGFLADYFSWRTCYFIGGGLGLLLLGLRVGVTESGMFKHLQQTTSHSKGDFLALFKDGKTFLRYIRFIFIGLPVWFVVAIPVSLAPEFGKAFGAIDALDAGKAVMFCYGGLAIGDMVSGTLSQVLKSRKTVLYIFWLLAVLATVVYLLQQAPSKFQFYGICALMGFSVGSWVIFMTIAAEQFGTNIRATVTTTIPNFVRGSVPLMTGLFSLLVPSYGVLVACAGTGLVVMAAALWAITGIKETFGTDMDFLEDFKR